MMTSNPIIPEFCIPSPNCVDGVTSVIVRNWRLEPSHVEELSKYEGIREIQIDSREIALEAAKQIARLPNLDSLSFTSSAICDAHVKELAIDGTVASLSLFGAKVTDDACEYIRNLPLRSLSLPKTGITDLGLQWLASGRISETLTGLSLFSTRVTDCGIPCLNDFVALDTLSLRNTDVSDLGVGHLPRELVSLDLANTAITDSCAVQIRRLENLNFLSVQRTSIGSDFVEVVFDLPNLSVVYLDNTQIDDRCCDYIIRSSQLKEVSLHATNLTKVGKTKLRTGSPRLAVMTDG